jgi:diguanylate cyclase (GGDEF)-like protein/PAS domain S-box-containing protein
MIIGGTVLLYIGLQLFVGQRSRQLPNWIFLVVFALVHSYFVLVINSLTVRNVVFSFGILVICSQCAWFTLRLVDPETRHIARGVAMVFVGFCLVSVSRIVVSLIVPPNGDFFHSNAYDASLLLMYQMLYLLLTFGLSLTVNRRLVADLNQDINVRRQTEEALKLSEERFSRAFQSSPDAILISRLSDGRLVEVNEGFSRTTGYSREESIGSSALTMAVFADPRDRETIIDILRGTGSVRNHECKFLKKSGEVMTCLVSGEIIQLDGEAHLLSIVRDITEHKRVDEILGLRLKLREHAETHSWQELMQQALDKICEMTGSSIGFYHLVAEDQKMLSLQAWSTRTLREFCRAEGRGLHYSIDEAGVWVDCVRQKGPVIHNDYAALPHRRGLPDGHAEVVRELVVPVMRAGLVVAILGVGNKLSNYDEEDAELVGYVADAVWAIVERKQVEEEILQLNSRLEQLAMTDELTGVANRRLFFSQCAEEFKRARRYHAPFSIMILDFDGFKRINDTYGHDAGDLVLQCFASTLRANIREVDLVGRLGGDEFGVLLPNTAAKDATSLAERLRQAVENQECSIQERVMRGTVSVGVAAFGEDTQDFENMLKNADKAMYQAKDQGRNRVVMHG